MATVKFNKKCMKNETKKNSKQFDALQQQQESKSSGFH